MTIDRTSDTIDSTKLRVAEAVRDAQGKRDEDLLPPLTRKGPYEVLDLLGEGGMGRVYLARHIVLGREVALKTLRRAYAHDVAAVARFFGEARAVNQIAHENIVEITDFVDEGDDKYYIMELLRGETLSLAMQVERPFSLERTLHVMLQVASALAAVHRAHIVHRDLKPENIFLTKRGNDPDFVKVLDFGVAKLDERHGPLTTTAAGALIGTPEYMSPEQLGGKPVNYRADIYSFSLVLYEMVTGVRPFEAQSFGDLVVKHLTQEPLPPRKVPNLAYPIPRPLEDLILHGLAKEPHDRPDSMEQIVVRLAALDTHDVGSGRAGVARRPSASGRRTGFITAAAAAVGVAAALVAVDARDDAEERPPPRMAAVPNEATAAPARPAPASPAPASPAPGSLAATPPAPTTSAATPSAQAQVRVSLESKPAGAEVRLHGAPNVLGVTPCAVDLDRQDVGRFLFTLPGHVPLTVEQALESDTTLKVVLATEMRSKPKAVEKRDRPKPKREDRRVGDLLDPFAE